MSEKLKSSEKDIDDMSRQEICQWLRSRLGYRFNYYYTEEVVKPIDYRKNILLGYRTYVVAYIMGDRASYTDIFVTSDKAVGNADLRAEEIDQFYKDFATVVRYETPDLSLADAIELYKLQQAPKEVE